MLRKIIRFLTKRKTIQVCGYCKKSFVGDSYKSYYNILGFVNVTQCYCSEKCEKLMNKAIRKCEDGQKLNNEDKIATKNLRYIDIPGTWKKKK